MCLDKGCDNGKDEIGALINAYIPHVRRIGEEKLDGRGRKTRNARRQVVERTFAWLSKCRALLVRYEKKARNYLGPLQLACLLLQYRKYHRPTVLGWLLVENDQDPYSARRIQPS